MSGTIVERAPKLPTPGDRPSGRWLHRHGAAFFSAATVVGLVGAPLFLYAGALASSYRDIGFDLRYAYLPAAHDLIHGVSPYAGSGAHALAAQTAYVYPPLLAMLVVPLTALPATVASVVGVLSLLACVVAALVLLEVRDWRCYCVALLWAPVFDGVDNANVSILLALALAVGWRRRHVRAGGSLPLGVASAVKAFALPLLVWPAAVGRRRTALVALGAAMIAVVVPWAILGFAGVGQYPTLLHRLTKLEQDRSYSLHAVLTALGAPASVATAGAVLVAAALVAGAWEAGRRRLDAGALALAIGAALALSPIVWQHYLVLLLVPLAAVRPTLSRMWFLPLALWACDLRGDNGRLWQTALVPAVAAVLVAFAVRAEARARS